MNLSNYETMKVKDGIVFLAWVPNYETPIVVVVDYESIWTSGYAWKFQEYQGWCKQYVNIHGHFRKDGTMALRGIKVGMSFTEQGGWEPIDKSIKFKIIKKH